MFHTWILGYFLVRLQPSSLPLCNYANYRLPFRFALLPVGIEKESEAWVISNSQVQEVLLLCTSRVLCSTSSYLQGAVGGLSEGVC